MEERLQKILSARGIASRRKAEEYIKKGWVKVNGKPAVLGQKADPDADEIVVDPRVKKERSEMLYYLFYKPEGVLTLAAAKEKGKAITDYLPEELRTKVFPVGRLDKDSTGLIVLTNDGVLAHRLTDPYFDHEKEYEVTVHQEIPEEALQSMREGMVLLGGRTKPAKVTKIGEKNFRIALTEGKNRQIRRMCRKLHLGVAELRRVRILTLKDSSLKTGQFRPLSPSELSALFTAVKL